MVQVEQTNEPAQKPQMAAHVVQNATQPVCPLEYMPRLLIEKRILKSRMNRKVHVRFCEEQGGKIPLAYSTVRSPFVLLCQTAYCGLLLRVSTGSIGTRQAILQGWLLCVGSVCLVNVPDLVRRLTEVCNFYGLQQTFHGLHHL